jgi:hypothetical protein
MDGIASNSQNIKIGDYGEGGLVTDILLQIWIFRYLSKFINTMALYKQ